MTDRWDEIRSVGGRSQPSDPFFAEFARTGAVACLFELKVRLYADNTVPLTRFKDEKLEALVKRLVEHRKDLLQTEEIVHLKKCARVRNKLLHADFSKAAGTLLSFDVKLERGHVQVVDLATGETRTVSETNSTEGRIFGWVAEGARSNAFAEARRLLLEGVALINWMLSKDSGVA